MNKFGNTFVMNQAFAMNIKIRSLIGPIERVIEGRNDQMIEYSLSYINEKSEETSNMTLFYFYLKMMSFQRSDKMRDKTNLR